MATAAMGLFSGSANIEIGGPTDNQLVDHVYSYEPRGCYGQKNNTIWAQSAFIKTGIAIGPAVWRGDTTNYNRNGDGNIVIYGDQGALWATATNPSGTKFSPYLQVYNSIGAVI
ncbi:unnamed protein product [Didymodactylos carnosus]|uniref:Bulb-type lectin domain-containing protein n=1 Tax=Didymodactylos carnosus TaxID=1234261 RepID=A0A813QRF2_9BILA|nr:unnamed protein product [Didymodactylos carnosus]CAF0837109.1 unnamed protein product [Didymodactylos carnosus]CAF3554515.1 unnamed protein product [Didymodactylos carnosus]CAF3621945.1 unnamed protein product [Didymodactylos carnosus]